MSFSAQKQIGDPFFLQCQIRRSINLRKFMLSWEEKATEMAFEAALRQSSLSRQTEELRRSFQLLNAGAVTAAISSTLSTSSTDDHIFEHLALVKDRSGLHPRLRNRSFPAAVPQDLQELHDEQRHSRQFRSDFWLSLSAIIVHQVQIRLRSTLLAGPQR